MKVLNRIFSVILYLVFLFFGLGSLLVFGFSLVTTIRFRQYEQNDLFDVVRDNVPLLLLSILAVLALILVILRMTEKHSGKKIPAAESEKPAFPWPMVLVAAGISLFFVFVIHGRATNDALQLDAIMQDFAAGDYSSLNPGGYLFVYPFQIFYVWVGILIQTICGASNFLAYQILNVVSIVLNLYFLYQLTWELFENRDICRVMQVLACGCVFYYVYATFVYSDLWSFPFQTAAFYLQVLYMKRRKRTGESAALQGERKSTGHTGDLEGGVESTGKTGDRHVNREKIQTRIVLYEIGAGVCIAIACLLKSNCYVALIAMMVLLVVDGVRGWKGKNSSISSGTKNDRNRKDYSDKTNQGKGKVKAKTGADLIIALFLAAMLLLMTRGAQALVNGITCRAAGIPSFPQGVPSINYIAMGMQEAEGKYGWYNGTNVGLYRDAGWDRDASTEAAKASIQESIGEFRNSGRYFARFYIGKFLSQWGDPTCVSMRELEETERHVEPVYPIASWLIFGEGSEILQWVMNVFHSVIWLGACVFAFAALRIPGMRRDRERRQNGSEVETDGENLSGSVGIKNKMKVFCLRGNAGVELVVLFIFGGMVFHEIWEASGRYTMRYYLAMLPLASWGIWKIAEILRAGVNRWIRKGKSDK